MPTTKTLAKLNKLHYKISDGDNKTKNKAIKKVDKLGYTIEKQNRGVMHVRSKDLNDVHNIVTVKGTDPTNKKDLFSDLSLAIGSHKSDKQFKKRKSDIKEIYTKIGDKEDKYLTGHSLGGSVVNHAMTSKSIRDNTKKAETFNAGYTPLFHSNLSKDLKKEDKKDIKSKLINHHQKGDVISAFLTDKAIGRVVTHKEESNKPHSLDNFTKEE